MNASRRKKIVVSCSATVTDEFELQVTKTGDKVRNWKHVSKIEWRDDEIGRENLYYYANENSLDTKCILNWMAEIINYWLTWRHPATPRLSIFENQMIYLKI